MPENPLENQVGGSHYKDSKIQPIEFIVANEIPYREANISNTFSAIGKKTGLRI